MRSRRRIANRSTKPNVWPDSLFWSEARHAFVHFDRVPELDWNRAYRDFLPQVVTAKNTRDYYAVLMRFAALLHDGHTNVYPPEALEDRFYARGRRCAPRSSKTKCSSRRWAVQRSRGSGWESVMKSSQSTAKQCATTPSTASHPP
jgi:hypothetical protein